ncbi:ELWxxDGT repeat protein [Archangium sp. Cb G35]|uniref:ELWxxDGT repeat protein n=1 Tax=Archangium sp. Cb G35 TaxID=1920190 RepID=UPI000935F53A|nr:ELWxxDGT repeat protein [Archangium sp. Cb G35]
MPLPSRHRSRRLPFLLLSAAIGCTSSAPEQDVSPSLASQASRALPPGLVPSLVKDIQVGTNTQTPPWDKGSWLEMDGVPEPVSLGPVLYFTAIDESTGQEPWRTDGTAEGTRLVRELIPGYNQGDITGLATAGGSLFISTEASSSDGALWKSDGTAAGTVRFGSREDWTNPGHLISCNGQLFFQDHVGGPSFSGLWKSDGTLEGTVKLSSQEWVFPSLHTSSSFTCAGGTLFFVTFGPSWDNELWKSDGTPEGTMRLATLTPLMIPLGDDPFLSAAGSRVFLAAATGIWTSDGTPEGTTLLHGEGSAEPLYYAGQFTTVGGRLYFTAFDATFQHGLWTSDGTDAGTRMLLPIFWGPPPGLVSLGDTLLASVGTEVYRSNGTPESTARLDGLSLHLAWRESARLPDGRWLISTSNDTGAPSLWVTDGTSAGTTPLLPAQEQGFLRIRGLKRHGDFVQFWAEDGRHGMEPWVTDGTPAGTRLLRDIHRADSSNPRELVDLGGTLLFTAQDAEHDRELWKSDGTAEGTVRLTEFSIAGVGTSPEPLALTRVGERVFFFWGGQLWKTDGTAAGTQRVHSGLGTVYTAGTQGTALFFNVFSSTRGWELWTSDGTTEGTLLLKDIYPGSRSANPGNLTRLGSTLFFSAEDGVHGTELWKTDGTPGGTVLVKDIRPGPQGSALGGFVSVGSTLYFFANDGVHGQELWKSDGTAEGTVLVADIHPGTTHYPRGLVARDGTVFFLADDGVHGQELWKSDGTAAGTRLVADIVPGPGTAFPPHYSFTEEAGPLHVIHGALYFTADDGIHGAELWKSDGTAAGTHLLRDITPGAAGSFLWDAPLVAIGPHGTFAFPAPDAAGGLELWRSDGTSAGTRPLHDLAPGAHGSSPARLTVSGPRLFFVADEGEHGRELWSVKQAAFHQRP